MDLGFFKKHKILSVFLALFCIFILGSSVFLLIKFVSVSIMDFPTERHYVTYMKGVWEPSTPFLITADDIIQMKDDNINTLSLGPMVSLPFPLSNMDELTITGLIKEAKKQGMAVHIAPQIMGGFDVDPETLYPNLEQYTTNILHWAELSEEYGVEYFSPLNEADLALHRNKAIEWHAEILPKIREIYSGKVIAKWSCWDDDDSIDNSVNNETEAYVYRVRASGDFDGVMLDIPLASQEEWQYKYFLDISEEWDRENDPWRPSSLEEIIIATSQASEEIGIPIYVGEFHVETTEAPFGLTSDKVIFTQTEQAEIYGKFLDIVMPHYDGVIHCFWIFPGGGIKNTPAEHVVKEKFGKY